MRSARTHSLPPRSRVLIGAAAVALLAMIVALGAPQADAGKGKKKKKKKAAVTLVASTGSINQVVPEEAADGTDGFLKIPIVIGKKGKGREIADVNVSLRLTGAVESVAAFLSAPNGAPTRLVGSGDTTGSTWGSGPASCAGSFLTIDDESTRFVEEAPPSPWPDALFSPYVGRVQPDGFPLRIMDGGPAKGTWTLKMLDDDDGLGQATLHCAQIVVKTRRRLK